MCVCSRCDHEPDCKKDDLYKRFLPPEEQPWGCEHHSECELHVVWVRCVNDGGMHHSFLKGHMCPEYYYAHKYVPPAPPPPPPPPPGPPPALPPPPPPPPPPAWMPTPWESAEKMQHVESQDKYLDGVHLGDPEGGHVYDNGEVLQAPEGRWALSLPSDDNKLRRKWYATQAGDGDALHLPEGRGELVPGGQGSSLRWRPKYRYAHGFAGQDGPHWLGGYSDIRDPPKVGADSVSGKGLPRVNVYDWGLDRDVHPHSAGAKAIGHAKFSLWQDVQTIGSSLKSLIWPGIRA